MRQFEHQRLHAAAERFNADGAGRALRVLCVSPRFAPSSAADTHRLRLLAPYLSGAHCEIEVLAVDARDIEGPVDPELEESLPADLRVHRVRAWPGFGWGLRGLSQRAFVPLYRKGCELLAKRHFDLVFFSTTEFLLHALGPLWRRRFGVSFCMDFQDPWVNDYYRTNPHVEPPGGRFKYGIASTIHRSAEKAVVRRCDGFLAVSPDYLPALETRYGPAIARRPWLVEGFPAEPRELASLPAPNAYPDSGPTIWRYIGRGGPDMEFAASAFLNAWRQAIDAGIIAPDAVHLEIAGTSYARTGTGNKSLEPLAARPGLQDFVRENTDRLAYRETLKRLRCSHALVVFGSNDPAYTASKIYPYLLARRPLLTIFHRNSSVVRLMEVVGGGVCVTFDAATTLNEAATAIYQQWFVSRAYEQALALDEKLFENFTARTQAARVIDWFERVVEAREVAS